MKIHCLAAGGANARRRLLVYSLLVACQALWLLGLSIRETGAFDYEAYVVRDGQTIAAIADEYGIPAAILAQYNKLNVADPLAAGQVLIVPALPREAPRADEHNATAVTPSGDRVDGVLAVVSAAQAEIRNRPGGGQVLFAQTARGTELLVIGDGGKHYALLMADGSTGWIEKKAVLLTERRLQVTRPTPPTAPVPAQETRSPLIDTAFEYMGTPYRYGGRLPRSVDCSLLVQTVFARHGVRLPRTAAQQFNVGAAVDVTTLRSGDRLYFYDRSGDIGHTGLYIGSGQFIHASSNRGEVAVDMLTDTTYWKKYAGARR